MRPRTANKEYKGWPGNEREAGDGEVTASLIAEDTAEMLPILAMPSIFWNVSSFTNQSYNCQTPGSIAGGIEKPALILPWIAVETAPGLTLTTPTPSGLNS